MLNYQEIENLLAMQQKAYELLMWLNDAATWRPDFMGPQGAELLHKPAGARQWLESHQAQIPPHLFAASGGEEFINLFSSFFATSFHVGHFEFDGKLIESNIKLRSKQTNTFVSSPNQCEFLAFRHLCNAEKLYLTDKETKTFIKSEKAKDALRVWTYVWELDRRAKGKGKGPVVHQIWRSIPLETRKTLNAAKVWHYREQLLTELQAFIAECKN